MTKITICPQCTYVFKPDLLDLDDGKKDPKYSLTAAEKVIAAFDGVKQLSALTGIKSSAIYHWSYPESKNGCDGRIPSRHHKIILKIAKNMNFKLNPEDLVNV